MLVTMPKRFFIERNNMIAEIVEHLDEAFHKAVKFDTPYPLYYFKPFSDKIYLRILENLPASDLYVNNDHRDAYRKDGSISRSSFGLKEERLSLLPATQRNFWRDMNEALRSVELQGVIAKWHDIALSKLQYPFP